MKQTKKHNIRHYMNRLVLSFSLTLFLNSFLSAQSPELTIAQLAHCPNGQVSIPVTANNLENIGALSIFMTYEPTSLTFVAVNNVHPGIQSIFFAAHVLPMSSNMVGVQWFLQNLSVPVTIPDGDTLFHIVFDHIANSSAVMFYNAAPYLTEVYDYEGNVVLPLSLNNGGVTIPSPISISISGDDEYCENDNLLLTAGASGGGGTAYAFQWLEPLGTVIANTAQLSLLNVIPSQSGTYTVIVSENNSLCDHSENISVIIHPRPYIEASASNPICDSTALNLYTNTISGTMPYDFSWTAPNGWSGIGAAPVIDPASLADGNDTIYTVIVTDLYGCKDTASTADIVIFPKPTVDDIPSIVLCNGDNTPVIAFSGPVTGTTYTWINDTPSIGIDASGTGNILSGAAMNGGSAAVVATITVTPHANGCTGNSKTFTITVNPTAQVNDIPDQVLCNGDDIQQVDFTTTNTGGTMTYQWSNDNPAIGLAANGSGSILPVAAMNGGAAPVVANITVTPTFTFGGTGCTGPVKTFTITVNPTGQANQPADLVQCNTDLTTVTFTTQNSVGVTTYAWANSNTSIGLGANGNGDISFTAMNGGATPVVATITVTPTFSYGGTGCDGPTQTFTITVNPTGQADQPVDLVQCNEDITTVTFTTLNSGGVTTYAWSNTNAAIGLASNGNGNISFTAMNGGATPVVATVTVTPTFTYEGISCEGPSKTFTITVNPTGQADQPVDLVQCNTDHTTVTFTTQNITGVTTYAWSNSNPAIGLIASGTGNISFTAGNSTTAPITGTITVTPTFTYEGVSCEGPSKTFTITVNPTGQADQPLDLVQCNTDLTTVTFTTQNSVGVTTYAWSNTNPAIGLGVSGNGDISFTAMNGGATPVVATIIVTPTFTYEGISCEGPSKTFTITVNPTGQADQPVDQVKCNQDLTTVTFTTQNSVGVTTYAWSNSNASIGLDATGTGDISFTATNATTAPITGTITVTPTFTYMGVSCEGPSKTFTITVNPTGQVNPPADQVKCNTDLTTVTFTTTHTVGVTTYAWSNDNTAIGLDANGNGNISFTAMNGGATPVVATITVTPTFTYEGISCEGPSKTFTITVNPTGQADQPADMVQCNEALTNVQFTTQNTVGVTTYAWANSNTSIGLVGSGNGDISFTATNTTTAPISGTITVTPTYTYLGVSCEGPSKTFTITVNPTGQADQPADQVKCNNDITTVIFTAQNTTGVTTYAWSNSNASIGLAANGNGNISFTAMNDGATPVVATITVTPTFTYEGVPCEGPSKTFTITVNPTGQADQPVDQVKCNEDITTVTFTTQNSVGVTTYAWANSNTSIGLVGSGNGDISFTATNTTTAPISGTITVTPTFTYDGVSCEGPSKFFTITVNPTGQADQPVDLVQCNEDLTTVTFTTQNSVGVTTYAWANSNTSIGLVGSGNGDISFTAMNGGATPVVATITVTPTFTFDGVSCEGPSKTFTITVNPTGQADQPVDLVQCNEDITTVAFTTQNNVGVTTYAWANSNTSIGLGGSGNGDISFTATNTTTAPISGTITVTPTFTYDGVSCEGPSKTFTITVNPTGQADQPVDLVQCNEDITTVTFTTQNSVGVTTYAWSNSNASIGLAANGNGNISFTAMNSGATPVVANITVTPTFTYMGVSCEGPSKTFTITVNPTGQVDQPVDQVKCNQDLMTVVFTSQNTVGTTTYAWINDNPSIGLGANGNGNISFTAINGGATPVVANITVTPTFTYEGISCEGPSKTFTITVNPTGQVDQPADQVKCNQDLTTVVFTTLNTVGTTTYAWANDNINTGLAATGNGNISFTAMNGGTTPVVATITVTPTFTYEGISCEGPSKTFVITVNPTGQVDLPADQVKCNQDPANVIFTTQNTVGTTTYVWSNSNIATGLAASGDGDISFTATNVTTSPITSIITVTPTFTYHGVSCEGPSQSFSITVNPTAQADTPDDQVKCNQDVTSVIFTTQNTSGVTTYEWSNSNTATGLAATGTGDISFTATNSTTAPITSVVTVTPTFANGGNACEGLPQSFSITVNPTGQVNGISGQELCHNTPTAAIAFTTINTGGTTTYAWSHNTPGIGIPVSGNGNIAGFTAINGGATPVVVTFTVTPTFSFGGTACPGPVETFTITINPRPNADAGPDQTIANGAFTTLNGSASNSPGPFSYAWTPTGMLVSSNIPDPQTVNLSTTQIYTLVVTDQTTGCSSLPDNVTIIVFGGPLGVVATADPDVICFGDSTTLSALGAGGTGLYTYTWTSNPPGFSAGTDITVTFPQQSAWYVVAIDDGFNIVLDSVFVTVNPKPEITASSNTPICDSTAINLSTTVTGGTSGFSYAWNAPNGWSGADEPNPVIAVASLAGNYNTTYTVVVTDANGCRDTATTDVFIFPKPTVDNIPSIVICNNDNTPVIAFSGPVPGTTYTWTNNTPSIGIDASGTGNILSVAAMNGGSANVVATITVTPHANGCTGNSRTFTITVMPTPAVDPITDQVHCNQIPVVITPVTGPVSGTLYTWTNSNPAIGLAAGGNGNIPAFTATNTGIAPVSATITIIPAYTFSGHTCGGPSSTYSITVNPTGQLDQPANQVKCNQDLTTVVFTTQNTVGTSTYAWANSNTNTGLAATGDGDISFTAINGGTTPLVATITVTPTFTYEGISCEGPVKTFTITVNPTGQADQPVDLVQCNTDLTTVTFTTQNSVGVTTYAWSNDNTTIGLAANGNGNISFTAMNGGAAPVVATITVTPTFSYGGTDCDGPTQTFTITVNPTGQVNPPADQVKCNTDLTTVIFTTTHSVGVTTYAWSNDNTAIGLAATGNGNISFTAMNGGAAPVVATITVTPTFSYGGTDCDGPTQTFTITVNPTGQADQPADQVICNQDLITVVFTTQNTVGTTTYAWINDNPSIGLAASGVGSILSIAAMNGGATPVVANITVTPTFTYEGVSCEGPSKTFTITVNPTGQADQPVDLVQCNEDITTVTFTTQNITGVTTYAWTNTNTTIGLDASGTGDISFTAMNGGVTPVVATIIVTPTFTYAGVSCEGPSKTFTITVNPTGQADQPADQVLCNEDLLTVIFTTQNTVGTTTYTWINDNPSIGLGANGNGNISFTAINGGATPVAAIITVTPTFTYEGVSCEGPSKTFTITVNPTGQADQPANLVQCNEDLTTVTFTTQNSVGVTTYAWSNSNASIGLAANGNGNISFTAMNGGATPVVANITVTPTFTYDGVSCEGPSKTFTITVNPTGQADQPVDQVKCNQDLLTVTFTTQNTIGTTTYAWTNDNPSIGLGANGNGNISFTAINGGATPVVANITVTPTFTYEGVSCEGPSKTFTITVNPTGQTDQPADQVKCNQDLTTVVFTTQNTVGTTTYAWANDNINTGLAATGNGNISFTAMNGGTTPVVATITVTPTFTYEGISCEGPSKTFVITVNPTGQVDLPADQVKCNQDPASVIFTTQNTVGTTTYVWSNSNIATGLAASGDGDISFTATNVTTSPITSVITVTPTFTYHGVSCEGPSQSFSITVNPTAQADTPDDQVKCNQDATSVIFTTQNTLGITTYEWSNSNTATGLAATGTGDISFTATNNTTAPITSVITVTPTFANGGNACEGPPQSFSITVNPTGQVNGISGQELCHNTLTDAIAFTTINTGGTTTYAWSHNTPGIGIPVSGNGNIAGFTAINGGATPVVVTFTVTPTFSFGGTDCTGPVETFTITINPRPNADAGPDQTIPNGVFTTLDGSASNSPGPFSYAWTPPGMLVSSNIPDPQTVNLSTTQVYTLIVTDQTTGCSSLPDNVTIIVAGGPLGVIATADPDVICFGDSTTLSALGAGGTGLYTFTWTSNPPGFSAGSDNTVTFPQQSAWYVVAIDDGFNIVLDSVFVTVNPKPEITASSNTPICDSTAINLSTTVTGGTSGFSYAWNAPNGWTGADEPNPVIAVASLAGNYNTAYTVVVTDVNGCRDTATTVVFIFPKPTVDDIPSLEICNNDNTPVIAFSGPVPGTTYTWTNNTPSIGIDASGTGNILSVAAMNGGSANVVATITVTPHANGCTGNSKTFTITVFPTPTVNPVASQELCHFFTTDAVTFTGSVDGTTYGWYNNLPAIGIPSFGVNTINATQVSNITPNPLVATITVTPEANGCTGIPFAFTITVNPRPLAIASAVEDTLCTNQTLELLGSATGGSGQNYQFTWTGPAAFSTTVQNPQIPLAQTSNSGAYLLMVTDDKNCSAMAEDTVYITVHPLPAVSFLAPYPDQCYASTSFQLTGGNPSGGTYTGSNVTGGIFNPEAAGIGTHTVVYHYTDGNTCTDSVATTITVVFEPMISGVATYDNAVNTTLGSINIDLLDILNNPLASTVSQTGPGTYAFKCLDDEVYQLAASTTQPIGGVNAADALLALQYSLGQTTLTPFRQLAGDVNNNTVINSGDALMILRRFANLIPTFPIGDWLFDIDNPVPVSGADVQRDILCICAGDINGSYEPNFKYHTLHPFITKGLAAISTGNTIEIPVKMHQRTLTSAISLVIEIPYPAIKIVSVNTALSGSEYNIIGKQVRFGWFNLNPVAFEADDILLTLVVSLDAADLPETGEMIRLFCTSETEFSDKAAQPIPDVQLYTPLLIAGHSQTPDPESNFWLGAIKPNPVSADATMAFYISESCLISVEITDVYGRSVMPAENIALDQGKHEIQIRGTGLPPGVYHVRISARGKTVSAADTRKMVITR